MVPVDFCINNMLAAAWDMANKSSNDSEIPVYNLVPHKDNTRSYKDLIEIGFKAVRTYPSIKTAWYYCFEIVESSVRFRVLHFFYHVLPAMFIDLIMWLTGQKFRMQAIYQKIVKLAELYQFFSFRSFEWNHDNVSVRVS